MPQRKVQTGAASYMGPWGLCSRNIQGPGSRLHQCSGPGFSPGPPCHSLVPPPERLLAPPAAPGRFIKGSFPAHLHSTPLPEAAGMSLGVGGSPCAAPTLITDSTAPIGRELQPMGDAGTVPVGTDARKLSAPCLGAAVRGVCGLLWGAT